MKGAVVPLCLLGLGLGGCGEGQELRAFDGAKLKVFMPREPDGQGISLRLEVTDDGCPSISGTKAFVNGHELELVEPGGRKPGPQDPRYDTCSRPQFSSSKTPRELGLDQELSRFELVDGDERRVIEGRWLLARRELKWKNPGQAHSPAAGQVLVLEAVGPEGDVLMDDDHWAYALFSAKEPGGPGWSGDLTRSTDAKRTFSITAPPFARAVPGRVIANILATAEVTRCDKMESCRIHVTYGLEQELTPSAP